MSHKIKANPGLTVNTTGLKLIIDEDTRPGHHYMERPPTPHPDTGYILVDGEMLYDYSFEYGGLYEPGSFIETDVVTSPY